MHKHTQVYTSLIIFYCFQLPSILVAYIDKTEIYRTGRFTDQIIIFLKFSFNPFVVPYVNIRTKSQTRCDSCT